MPCAVLPTKFPVDGDIVQVGRVKVQPLAIQLAVLDAEVVVPAPNLEPPVCPIAQKPIREAVEFVEEPVVQFFLDKINRDSAHGDWS